MPRTIREQYFDPDYIEIKHITEDTTLYSLMLHGYLSTYLFKKLRSFDRIGEVIDTPIKELMKIRHFGSVSFKHLKDFFEENHGKFKLKVTKARPEKDNSLDQIKVLEKKLTKYEDELHSTLNENYKINEALQVCNLDLTAHKGLEKTLWEQIDDLKNSTDLAKLEYDNYYKDSLNDLHQKIKQKDEQIASLNLSNRDALNTINLLKINT